MITSIAAFLGSMDTWTWLSLQGSNLLSYTAFLKSLFYPYAWLLFVCYFTFNHIVVILAVSAWILLARKSPAEASAPVAAETRDVPSNSVEPETKPAADHAPLATDTAVEDDDSVVAHSNSMGKSRRKRVEMRVIYGTTTVLQ